MFTIEHQHATSAMVGPRRALQIHSMQAEVLRGQKGNAPHFCRFPFASPCITTCLLNQFSAKRCLHTSGIASSQNPHTHDPKRKFDPCLPDQPRWLKIRNTIIRNGTGEKTFSNEIAIGSRFSLWAGGARACEDVTV
jgi:hypothetical protein